MLEASTPFYPLSVGELVGGKYRITSILGEGGMGIVFAAKHVDLHCDVAIKVIRQELNQQPELIARLMLEARAAAQIRSEHVCRVLDVARLDAGTPYVVMEYLDGKNLASVLDAKGRLPERLAVDYLLQACEAVAEAHRAGVVHRDLKPENLFLAEFPDGRRAIKVLDFGISKATGAWVKPVARTLTNPSSAMGSPHYMAPEQMTAARDVDARADIWALGTILHQLVTGHLAFDGDSLPAVCAAVLQSDPIPVRQYLPELSVGLEEAIQYCLIKNREQRLATVADLARLISTFGSPQAVQSAARIYRLLDEAKPASSSGEPASSTLLSPSQLPTPRTPIKFVPIETTVAVTSSKRAFAAFGNGPSGRRWRVVRLIGAVLLLSGISLAVVLARTSNRTQSPIPDSSLRAPGPDPVIKVAAAPLPPTQVAAVSSAEVASPPLASTSDRPNPLGPPKRSTATPAVRAVTSDTKHNSTATHNTITTHDPYNSDNFGGRR
jgi:serine/threonine-protein kinase